MLFVASVNCRLQYEHPLLRNISRLHADMDYIRTNFDRSLQLLESVVQSHSTFNATLTRLDQSAADLQRSHDSLNASLAAMEESLSSRGCS